MPNEEIAKELTIALVNKMTNPTPDSVSETYHAILNKIGEPQQAITLQNIEDHLKKIEKDTIMAAFLHPLALAAVIVLGGITILYPNAGVGLLILGVLYFIYIGFRYIQYRRKLNS